MPPRNNNSRNNNTVSSQKPNQSRRIGKLIAHPNSEMSDIHSVPGVHPGLANGEPKGERLGKGVVKQRIQAGGELAFRPLKRPVSGSIHKVVPYCSSDRQ